MSTPTLFLTGQYGSGKNTYEDVICGFFGVKKIIKMSELLSQDPIAKEYITNGKLVPDEQVFKLLNNVEIRNSCVNGFPRTQNQANFLIELQKKHNIIIVVLDIDKELAERRLLRRLECDKCKNTVSENNGFGIGYICPICLKGKFVKRDDDASIEIIRQRLNSFHQDTIPGIQAVKGIIQTFYINIPRNFSVGDTSNYIRNNLKSDWSIPICM